MPAPNSPVPSLRLDGHAVLVTGANKGLGRSIADTLHALGARVYGTARNLDQAEQLARDFGTTPVVLNLSNPEASQEALRALLEADPEIDLLVNNAGVNHPQPATEVELAKWDEMYATNVRGTFLVSQVFGRHWIDSSIAGVICTVSSQAGRVAIENRSGYSSTKAAVDQLTKNLAFEWGPHGIRVNAVAPTFVRTELTASTLNNPEVAERLRARIPLGRFGEPHEVSSVVAFLLSDASSLVTGHTLLVDGGYTIH